MKELVFATSIFLFASASPADPVTAPEQAERNYRAIGGGLYLTRDDDLAVNEIIDPDGLTQNSPVVAIVRMCHRSAPGSKLSQ